MKVEDLVTRVRSALGGRREVAAPAPPVDAAWRTFSDAAADGGLVERFVAAARAVGAEVERCVADGLGDAVARVLSEAGATRVGYGADCGLARAGTGSDGDPFELHAGVTGVAAAIARSGTIALHSGPGRPGMLSTAPPLHVAVVRAEQIVGSLADYLATPVDAEPSARVLVTGPSKTADIEGILITGVHGPGRLVIIVVG